MYVYRQGWYSLFWCVVFRVAWRVVMGVVGSGKGEGREGVRGVWHGCTLRLLTSRAKNKTLLSEDCKNITEELLLSESKRPLGGGASRGEAEGSLLHT